MQWSIEWGVFAWFSFIMPLRNRDLIECLFLTRRSSGWGSTISTPTPATTPIRLGYVKGNRMTNVKSSNIKLKERSLRILMAETGLDEEAANDLLGRSDNDLRVALVMERAKVGYDVALNALNNSDFVVEKALSTLN